MKTHRLLLFLLVVCTLLGALPVRGQIQIILRESFVDSMKHRVTIDTDFDVVKAHARVNSPSKDGDMHVAGWGTHIGLPVVAELMNARDERGAVDLVHAKEGRHEPTSMKGAWRIWCEHPGGESTQEQGGDHPPITNTNPDHVFEVHPVTRFGDLDLIGSLKPINGFTYKDAERSFNAYSNVRCKLEDLGDRIMIGTSGVGYNYVDFQIELADDAPLQVTDGHFAFCKVLDLGGELLVQKMRMAFPAGSAAERELATLQRGGRMHVIGVPRVSLALVDYRLEHGTQSAAMLEWNLPVEMIIVATFGEPAEEPVAITAITDEDDHSAEEATIAVPANPPPPNPQTPTIPMTPDQWLTLILLGALLGMACKGIRAVVGLKKVSDANAGKPDDQKEALRVVQLAMGLFIAFAVGGIAGILAAMSMDKYAVDGQILTAFLAAGYAGTDFIEGFMTRNSAKVTGGNANAVRANAPTTPTVTTPGTFYP